MVHFVRMLLGLALLPMCWGVVLAFVDSLVAAAGASGGISPESVALLGGIAAFALLLDGARPSRQGVCARS